MAKQPRVVIGVPTLTPIDGGYISRWDESNVVLELWRPEYDRFSRLTTEIIARMGDTVIHHARINLLNQYECNDFHKACFSLDGHVDWQAYLITVKEPLGVLVRQQAKKDEEPRPTVELPQGLKVKDLLRKTFTPARSVVQDVILEGLQLMVGKPKIGKSRLMLDIAVAVAFGGKALGQKDVDAGDVLYLSLEDPERRLQKRFIGLLVGRDAPDTLEYHTAWPRANEGGLDALEQWIQAHAMARLIIIDTLKRFKPKALASGNGYDTDYESLAGLQDLANQHPGVSIVPIHHTNKMQDVEDIADLISGTTGLPGAVDGFAILRRQRGSADATLAVIHRDLEDDQDHALKQDTFTGGWTYMGTAAQYRLSREQQEILRVMQEAGEPQTPRLIADALGRNDKKSMDALYVMLAKMVKTGALTSAGRGIYSLP
jgi:AAA domain